VKSNISSFGAGFKYEASKEVEIMARKFTDAQKEKFEALPEMDRELAVMAFVEKEEKKKKKKEEKEE